MPELTFKSAGVSSREIDLTSPSPRRPSGVPAGVIGTADAGPAFVPVTVGSMSDFTTVFGNTDGEKFGPLAVNEWFKNAQALTYLRVLGAGDGKKRATDGSVTNAGFVVGEQQVQDNGIVGANPYAIELGEPGRSYFLGCYMSDSAGSTYLKDAGLQEAGLSRAHAIIRGVLFAASGVIPLLSGSNTGNNNQPSSTVAMRDEAVAVASGGGNITGSVNLSDGGSEFKLILNGHKWASDAPNFITASFDPASPMYFANVFNRSPFDLEKKGHYLYTHYDVHPAIAVVTGTQVLVSSGSNALLGGIGNHNDCAFILTSSLGRDAGSSTVPDYEQFRDRFRTPFSPYVVSQKFGSVTYDLFRVHALSDGEVPNHKYKVSVENIRPSTSDTYQYGSFDLVVRDFYDNDREKVVLEQFRGVNLDPDSDRFVARIVGDQRTFFEFDKTSDAQRIVVDGDYTNKSNRIRVQQSSKLKAGQVPATALTVGHRGVYHLVTSGAQGTATWASQILANVSSGTTGDTKFGDGSINANYFALGLSQSLGWAVEPPVPFRDNIYVGTGEQRAVDSQLYWGMQFSRKTSATEPNKAGLFDNTFNSYAGFFPYYQVTNRNVWVGNNPGTADVNGAVLDSDRFNNNIFSLERLKVRTGSDTNADPLYWVSASYSRKGGIATDEATKTRAFNVDDLKVMGNRTYAKFSFFLQGGFDGLNIFNKDKFKMDNNAAKREMDDSTSQGGKNGPTVASYRKALDVMGNESDVDIKLLAIPGMRHSSISDYAISVVEDRFDSLYIMDIEERDTLNNVVTSSAVQKIGVGNTVEAFKNRSLNTSFAAAYFPDVVLQDPTTLTNVRCPPSVGVLGAFALNDAVGHPWFAPAGFSRGSLNNILFAAVELKRDNLDELYDADINPITDFPGTRVVVWGQKTLLAAQSALDRVNVRRLLIEIRRKVRAVANTLLFEPNRAETLNKFSALVNPILQSIQERSGVERYKVLIDTTTTTQADVENNTIRGKIFLQPTKTAEFIALDFVVTNAGTEI